MSPIKPNLRVLYDESPDTATLWGDAWRIKEFSRRIERLCLSMDQVKECLIRLSSDTSPECYSTVLKLAHRRVRYKRPLPFTLWVGSHRGGIITYGSAVLKGDALGARARLAHAKANDMWPLKMQTQCIHVKLLGRPKARRHD